jgi:transposase
VNYVGIDLHKNSIVTCVMDQDRKITGRRTLACCQVREIRAYFESLGPFQAVVEATASYEWLFELIEPLADKLVLAHPGKLRVIAESVKKTDRLDARVLAEFLARDMVPTA